MRVDVDGVPGQLPSAGVDLLEWRMGLNEKRIQQVLDIEKEADAIHDKAVDQATQLPQQAQKEADELVAKARADAEKEAKQLIAKAQAEDERAQILSQAEEKIHRAEMLSMNNFDRAVQYVLARVVGRE
jgi:vacuolar-type H+-ATPase subunit H